MFQNVLLDKLQIETDALWSEISALIEVANDICSMQGSLLGM
jgi:hypothetical protein